MQTNLPILFNNLIILHFKWNLIKIKENYLIIDIRNQIKNNNNKKVSLEKLLINRNKKKLQNNY